jgi:hypothetical protein
MEELNHYYLELLALCNAVLGLYMFYAGTRDHPSVVSPFSSIRGEIFVRYRLHAAATMVYR